MPQKHSRHNILKAPTMSWQANSVQQVNSTQLLLLGFHYDYFKLTFSRERKRCSLALYSSFSNSICSLGQERENERWGGTARSCSHVCCWAISWSLTPHLQQTSSPLQGSSHFPEVKVLFPKGSELTVLDIQLVDVWRRQQIWGGQWAWSCMGSRGEGALLMHPTPAWEEVTHPTARFGSLFEAWKKTGFWHDVLNIVFTRILTQLDLTYLSDRPRLETGDGSEI